MNRREALKRVGYLMGGALAAPTVAGVLGGCRAGTDIGWSPQVLSAAQNDLVVSVAEHIIPDTDTPGATAAGVNRFIDRMLAEWYPENLRARFLTGLDDLDRRAQDSSGQSFLDLASDQQRQLLRELDRETFAPQSPTGDVRERTTGSGEDPLDEPVDELESDAYGAADSARASQEQSAAADTARADTTAGPPPRSDGGTRISASLQELVRRQIDEARRRTEARRADGGPIVRADVAHEGTMVGDSQFFPMMKELTLVGYYTSEVGATEELRYEPVPGRWEGCVPFDEIERAWAV